MHPLFDSSAFNERLFFPGGDVTPCPAGATDAVLEVDGARVAWRWHRSPAARAVILLFHGNGEVIADYDHSAQRFAEAGAELAVVDYRGYGQSSGTPTLRSAIEDAPRVLEALLARADRPVVVMGRSVGSAAAAELYGRNPAGVSGLIYESGSIDLAGLAARRGMILPALDHTPFDPRPKLERGRLPFLGIHGAEDAIIDASEGRRAFEAAGGTRKHFALLPEVGHNNLASAPAYWSAIAEFLASL
ncbi:MAG: alpha/beta fold hydrolase [Myxococcota bacterium]